MASKAKEQLQREHLTDQQWADFSRVAEFIHNWRRRKWLATVQRNTTESGSLEVE